MTCSERFAVLVLSGIAAARKNSLFRRVSLVTTLLLVPGLLPAQTFIQVNNNTVDSVTASVSVPYNAVETAGDLNVVVVGWSDNTASVTSVADDNANQYALVGTTVGNGVSQAIYYARNIVVAPNNSPTVTVTFNQAAAFPDVRVLEYSGLSTTGPLDAWAGSSGGSTLADSGAATTTTSDLVLGAGTTDAHFTAAGATFTLRAITHPFGDLVEDSAAALPAGSYNATATQSDGSWAMQMVAFSTTGVTFMNPPTIDAVTPIAPVSGPDAGHTAVTITGTNFQPGAVVFFGPFPGGVSGANCAETGGTTINCLTPASGDGAVDVTVVNVDGQFSTAAAAFTFLPVVPPLFASISPATGPTNGSAVTVTGGNFQNGATVTIGGLPASQVVVQDAATITAITPAIQAGPADVTVTNPDAGSVTSTGAFTFALGSGPINYVQSAYAALTSSVATVSKPLPNLQRSGDLNVVIVGWADGTSTVTSVTDSEGNTYQVASPLLVGLGLSQVIYYAKNIASDTVTPNQITVTFSQPALAPDVRILEYSGISITDALDTTAGNAGTGTLADSGACTTTTPIELIVAGGTVGTHFGGAGSGFTLVALTQPNGDNAEHQITSVSGSCEATAPLPVSGDYVMQAAAFKLLLDFSLSALPATQTVTAGGPATYTVQVSAVNGFTGAVALTCDAASLPAGASCDFEPASVTPGGTSTLTISTLATTPAATSNVIVTGTSGSLTHNASVGLTVNASAVADFGLSMLPATETVTAGSPATYSVAVSAVNGFTGAVTLTCNPASLPTGASCAFAPASATAGGSSTLTISTLGATPVGTSNVAVTGASGPLTHTASAGLTITAAPVADFTITAAAFAPASVSAGNTATSTLTVSPVNGFSGSVNLTCAVSPVEARPPSCSISPSSVTNGSGTATVTVKTTAPVMASSFSPRSMGIFFTMLFPVGALALWGGGLAPNKKSRKPVRGFLFGCLLFSGLIYIAACGGGNSNGGGGTTTPGTPAGSYTITVTGTSGSLIHTTTGTLTVQ